MPAFRVGCVPYVNALPLVVGLAEDDVEVVFDVPSRLATLLDAGEVQAALVSSIEALRRPGARVVDGIGIGSFGPVESVRLFSKVPYGMIQTFALDQSSLTSNRMAQIVLRESYGARPQCLAFPPDLDAMLGVCDAALLIGDLGMTADPGRGVRILDLGEAWSDLTGLPFVWAMWTGGADLNEDLAGRLRAAYRRSGFDPAAPNDKAAQTLIEQGAQDAGWPVARTSHYLRESVRFDLRDGGQAALRKFAELLEKNQLATDLHIPATISG
jgi:chorismate dehydratase